MHVPSYMLHGRICPVTAAFAAVTLSAAVYSAYKSKEKPSVLAFGAVSSLVFGAQMLNFPVLHGTSGHLLGGTLAASLLGTPFAILAVSIVLGVQALFFGDGGINTLGANIINMGLIGAGGGGFILYALRQKGMNNTLALALASWISVVMAATVCSFELASANIGRLSQILTAMVSVHALIGMGEAILAVGLVSVINKAGIANYARTSFIFAGVAALLSPMSDPVPDGLQWVSVQLRLAHGAAMNNQAILNNYHVPALSSPVISTMTAAAIGISLVFVLASTTAGMMKFRRSSL